MSKAKNNIPRATIHVGAPAKSFSAAEGYEPERRGWDENTYRQKNQDTNNHYDFSRKHLNFEINGKGEIVPLGSNPVPLHERLQKRLDELGFKPYMDKNNPLGISDNSPNCTVGIIVSGDHDVLTRLAFGDQDVDFTLQKCNAHVELKQGIRDWALDTYRWACDRWGAENIIGFDVHLDETTPHIQIQTIPVAKTRTRGHASVKYVHKDDKSKVISYKEWKKLPEEIRSNFIRTEAERREKESVSYASVWGKDKYAVGETYKQMHTDYYNEVGHKYGLERGDDIAMLPGEERRERVHKSKAVLEAERQAKDAIARNQMENERLEGQKEKMEGEVQDMKKQKIRLEEQNDKLEGEIQNKEQHKERLEGNISQLEDYAAALDTYHWACDRWGTENIIGFDVHLDETTPHIQIQTIPVAKTKARGRASAKYVHKDDKSKVLSHKEWKKLPEEIRSSFVRTEVERREKECVSYARVWGEDKYAVGKTYYQMHTDYYNKVGHKYGLERGDDIAMLPSEERRERVHKSKAVLEAERQAKDAIARNQMENERLEGQKEKMAGEVQDMKK